MRFLFSGTASILAFLFFIYSPAFAITENINVFFNTPEEGVSTSIISNPEVGLDDSLVNLINSATPSDTIYAAFYEISDNSIMGALNTAAQAGTNVYFIKDNSTSDTDYNTLDSSINKKKGGSIMHNKFLVIKDKAIWMGSANPTRGGFITGNNNALVIKSAELARIYEDEFNHMWSGNFGSNKTLDQNGTKVTVDGVDNEVFS
ncbi:MAG: hypothetical protein GX817_04055 [Elusimicrobia bacterium]|nr:hypothetical protein [Elusimicrobiota bacterium]